MPRFEKNGQVRETALPRLAVRYRADGWKETKARTKRVKTEEAKPVEAPASETQVVVHPDAAEAPVEPTNTN